MTRDRNARPSQSRTIVDIARQHADLAAGATYDALLTQRNDAERALAAWHTAFAAGLALTADIIATNGHAPPLTVTEAASALNCGRSTIYDLLRADKLRRIDGFDGITRIPQSEIDRFQATRDGED